MKKLLGLAIVAGAALLSGCNRVDGEKYADELNKVVVARINSGTVKSAFELTEEFMLDCGREALRNLGYKDPDAAKITDRELEKFKKKIDGYKNQWIDLIAKKNG